MHIYNITFNVEDEIENYWLQYAKEVFVPNLLQNKAILNVVFSKVLVDELQGISYSIQVFLQNKQDLEAILESDFLYLFTDLQDRFKDKIVYFSTELEVID